jgi:hypothetical protein
LPSFAASGLFLAEADKTKTESAPQRPLQKKDNTIVSRQAPSQPQVTKSEILETVSTMLQNPEQIKCPLELAENLYRLGYDKQAAICYQQALKTKGDETPDHKDWILFQLGNCLHNDDPNAAVETYDRLLQECPESKWATLAESRKTLLQWYKENEPVLSMKIDQTSINESEVEQP